MAGVRASFRDSIGYAAFTSSDFPILLEFAQRIDTECSRYPVLADLSAATSQFTSIIDEVDDFLDREGDQVRDEGLKKMCDMGEDCWLVLQEVMDTMYNGMNAKEVQRLKARVDWGIELITKVFQDVYM